MSSNKIRLDIRLTQLGLVPTRSQAESEIKLRHVLVNGVIATKTAQPVTQSDNILMSTSQSYVSRAAYKLESVAKELAINFDQKIVLDVGSSTGGFTQFSLNSGAKKVIAVDVGKDQLHPILRTDKRIELFEKTDIRSFEETYHDVMHVNIPSVDLVVIDVSFISLRQILPAVKKLSTINTIIIAMLKPQFEVGEKFKNSGVIKNDNIRRSIIKDFEQWLKSSDYIILDKKDSKVSGSKGNLERFYKLRIAS